MKFNKELKRNGSYYNDPTAFAAMSNYIESENEKAMNKGEIWEVKMNNGTYKNVLVIADHGNLSTIIQVTENNELGNIEINCQGIKYTDPRRLQYAFNDTFASYIRTLKDSEFEKIMDAIAEHLGLDPHPTKTEAVVERKPKEVSIEQQIPFICDSEELIKAKAERDIFKGLYEKLLAEVMKGNGNV